MEVTIIFKIAAVGILVSILSQVLKHSGRDEQAFMVSLAGFVDRSCFGSFRIFMNCFQNHPEVICNLKGAENVDIIRISLLGICGVVLGFFFERNKNGICFVYNDGDRYHNSGTGCG